MSYFNGMLYHFKRNAPAEGSTHFKEMHRSFSRESFKVLDLCWLKGLTQQYTPTPMPTPTPLLLYSFLPSSPSTTLVVPVANDITYSITVFYRYSSLEAHGTDLPVLIWYAFHWLFKRALATQAASDLRLCLRLFFSQASTYSPLSPSMQRSAVKPDSHT